MERKIKTMDGNTAAAHVSYAFTEVAAIYPITPSSVMAEVTDEMATAGTKNLFGQTVKIAEMQSEGGAAGAVHGSLSAGALTTTYTASQGLLLMIPNMYKIAGELLPGVMHVSARCVATHALNIFGDHSDIYACRQTGYAMLCSSNVQEVMDLGAVAHLSSIKGRVPFLHFFDGFRTSHEIQKIKVWDYDTLGEMLDWDAVNEFRRRSLNPEHPVLRGSAQNPDIFFQAREACNKYYDEIVDVTENYMNEVNKRIGTDYKLFNYYGAKDAEHVIVAMGSVCDTIEETIDYLAAKGEKVGLIKVRLYRPFSQKHLLAALPETVKTISVLDRTKEPGSFGEPLFLDVLAAIKGTKFDGVKVLGGRYGLGSKDTVPSHIIPVFENMKLDAPKERFTLAINDDVTGLSLPESEVVDTAPQGTICCKFWGLGSDGTVGANKNSIKIIGDNTDMYAQGYFSYDSKKSGGITVSHLRFGKNPIKSTYLINRADFVACHNESYVTKYNMVEDIKPGGTFLLNCQWKTIEELDRNLPGDMKAYIANNNIKFYTIDASDIAISVGLGNRVSTILQSAFFKLTGILPQEKAIELMKAAATKSFSKKGDDIVRMNHEAIDAGATAVVKVDVPDSWKSASGSIEVEEIHTDKPALNKFVNDILIPANKQQGDKIPVSAFADIVDGTSPSGTAAFEKRGIALYVPEWQPDKCIQCNQCAYVCPHAVIRPLALSEEEAKNAPEDMKLTDMKGLPGYKFTMTLSPMDCTGCGSCVNICPAGAKDKANNALVMKPLETQKDKEEGFIFGTKTVIDAAVTEKFSPETVKGSQFLTPLLEFSGACAGCGETPYAKLVTQLFGDRMYVANATGCSSIWGNSAPSTPYTTNLEGKGPAWSNSLFEDNAEFGYGMKLANDQIRENLANRIHKFTTSDNSEIAAAANEWLNTYNDGEASKKASANLVKALEGANDKDAEFILENKDYLVKKSQWIFGGDGWAYDIGFGGLDHVLAQNKDVNVLVFDTEVYSNTGGQSSKSTPVGAIAQFAAGGKEVKKKDLAAIAMSYGYVYVAQVAMGADYAQTLKAIREAEAYNGPSIVIAYAPCINHGIKGGLSIAMTEEKRAVASGYWHMFRFDPVKAEKGENPFTLDSKAPTEDYQNFILNEVRYSSLKRGNPEKAERLFGIAEKSAAEKYEHLLRLKDLYTPAK